MTASPFHITNTCTLPKLYDRPTRTAYYKLSAWPVVTQVQTRTPTASRSKGCRPGLGKRAGTRLIPLEGASAGIAMEVAQGHSGTNWEALMNHINDSIKDTQQQRMLGQYMIQKLKREQTLANIPSEHASANKRCLESLIARYGTGLEGVVSKEREFERLIEAYQVFIRGDKKRTQRKVEKKSSRQRLNSKLEEPLPAIGDQKAGRSQVGCKIRQELRKEYGERVRATTRSSGAKRTLPTAPGNAPKPMSVRVRKSVQSGRSESEREVVDDRACDEMELPPTPLSQHQEEEGELQETDSQLSMTYVPSENQSVAQLLTAEESAGISVEFKQEDEILEEDDPAKEVELPQSLSPEPDIPAPSKVESQTAFELAETESELVLEGDSDSNVLLVDSQTEVSVDVSVVRSPKFEIVTQQSLEEDEEINISGSASETTSDVKEHSRISMNTTDLQSVAEEEDEEVIAADIIQPKENTNVPACAPAVESSEGVFSDDSAEVNRELKEVAGGEDAELEEVVGGEDGEEYRSAAIGLVNELLAQLDQEATGEGKVKLIHFKSSPDVRYYEKQSPERELACHPDDNLIIAEDLSTAETDLNEDEKALYYKVLSTAHTEPQTDGPKTSEETPTTNAADTSEPGSGLETRSEAAELALVARELTDVALTKATSGTQEEVIVESTDRAASPVSGAAKLIAEEALEKASSSSN